MTVAAQDRLAPVDMIVVEFPGGELSTQGFEVLQDLVRRHVIHILDLELVRRGKQGDVRLIDIEEAVAVAPGELNFLIGASSGLLDEDDVAFVGEQIEAGSLAAVVVFEHVWLTPLVDALEDGRARLVTAAHLDAAAVAEALADQRDEDDTEGTPA